MWDRACPARPPCLPSGNERMHPEAVMIDIKSDALRHVASRGRHVVLYYQPLRGC